MSDFLGGQQFPGLELGDLAPLCDHTDPTTLEELPLADVTRLLRRRHAPAAVEKAAQMRRVFGGSQPVLVCWVCCGIWLA